MLKNVFSTLHFNLFILFFPLQPSQTLDQLPCRESPFLPTLDLDLPAPGPSREGEIPSEHPGHAAPHSASLSQRDMYWPEFRTLQHEFSTIVSKLSKVLSVLTPAEFDSLLVYLR